MVPLFLCLSTQSLHPSFREPLHSTHTHFLAQRHTLKGGWAKPRTRSSHVHSHLAPNFLSICEKVFLFPAVPSGLSSHKDLVYSVTCIIYLRGRERREVHKAPSLSLPHLPSFLSGFSTSEHRPPLCFDVFERGTAQVWRRGRADLTFLPGFGCGRYFPRCFSFFFFLNGKWSCDEKWDVGRQA